MTVIGGLTGLGALLLALCIYALWIEPAWRLRVVRYDLPFPRWGSRAPMTFVILSDVHAAPPHVSTARLRRIVKRANGLGGDVAILLGDYGADHAWVTRTPPKSEIIGALAGFTAPLGTFAVLGNHDWWQDTGAVADNRLPDSADALAAEGIPLLENAAVPLRGGADEIWLAGLGDQRPHSLDPERPGFDDMDAALEDVPEGAPVVLLAHEPEIFDDVPDNVLLTLSGHTHGGQIRLGFRSPLIVASDTEKYAYGLYEHRDQKLVVSGGIGCSTLPLRLNMPPEITVVTLRGAAG